METEMSQGHHLGLAAFHDIALIPPESHTLGTGKVLYQHRHVKEGFYVSDYFHVHEVIRVDDPS